MKPHFLNKEHHGFKWHWLFNQGYASIAKLSCNYKAELITKFNENLIMMRLSKSKLKLL